VLNMVITGLASLPLSHASGRATLASRCYWYLSICDPVPNVHNLRAQINE